MPIPLNGTVLFKEALALSNAFNTAFPRAAPWDLVDVPRHVSLALRAVVWNSTYREDKSRRAIVLTLLTRDMTVKYPDPKSYVAQVWAYLADVVKYLNLKNPGSRPVVPADKYSPATAMEYWLPILAADQFAHFPVSQTTISYDVDSVRSKAGNLFKFDGTALYAKIEAMIPEDMATMVINNSKVIARCRDFRLTRPLANKQTKDMCTGNPFIGRKHSTPLKYAHALCGILESAKDCDYLESDRLVVLGNALLVSPVVEAIKMKFSSKVFTGDFGVPKGFSGTAGSPYERADIQPADWIICDATYTVQQGYPTHGSNRRVYDFVLKTKCKGVIFPLFLEGSAFADGIVTFLVDLARKFSYIEICPQFRAHNPEVMLLCTNPYVNAPGDEIVTTKALEALASITLSSEYQRTQNELRDYAILLGLEHLPPSLRPDFHATTLKHLPAIVNALCAEIGNTQARGGEKVVLKAMTSGLTGLSLKDLQDKVQAKGVENGSSRGAPPALGPRSDVVPMESEPPVAPPTSQREKPLSKRRASRDPTPIASEAEDEEPEEELPKKKETPKKKPPPKKTTAKKSKRSKKAAKEEEAPPEESSEEISIDE